MYVELHDSLRNKPEAQRAAELTTACVHCGFCLETCPTYLDYRDERDSPRGRIYLIKNLLETGAGSEITRQHLDRCLTCRSCETTCPSGMQYGELLDIGRELIEEKAPRPLPQRLTRWLLRRLMAQPRLVALALRAGNLVKWALPGVLRSRLPARQNPGAAVRASHSRKMLILEGCVQQAATPATNAAARRVLDRLGIELISAPRAGCCGALNYHLSAQRDGLDDMRRNIDAWWPYVEQGAEAIVSSASGCGAMLCDYGLRLAHDPAYAQKAKKISALHRDLAQALRSEDLAPLANPRNGSVAVHIPCTLQHAQQLPDLLPELLEEAGFELAQTCDDHLCCGSAGTYSILESAGSARLLTRKLDALCMDNPDIIATANVGCQLHLQSNTMIPVKHWIELLDEKR